MLKVIPNLPIREVASKLRDLCVNLPYPADIWMTDPKYSDRISVFDHNIVCKCILDDKKSKLLLNIKLVGDSSRYDGPITTELLSILER